MKSNKNVKKSVFQLTSDTKKKEVRIGGLLVKNYRVIMLDSILKENNLLDDFRDLSDEFYKGPDIPYWHLIKKESEFLVKYFGGSIYKRLNAAIYSIWIKPYRDIFFKKIFFVPERGDAFKISNAFLVNLFYERENLMKTVIKDGQFNIIAWCLIFNKNPQQLKELLGKSNWKKISNNSLSRNKQILYSYLLNFYEYLKDVRREDDKLFFLFPSNFTEDIFPADMDIQKFYKSTFYKYLLFATDKYHLEEKKDFISILLSIRYSCYAVNKGINYSNVEFMLWASSQKKIKISDKKNLELAFHLFKDTKEMCSQLDWVFKKGWSYNRVIEVHNKAQRGIRKKRFDDINEKLDFSWLSSFKNKKFKVDGITFSILSDLYDIDKEADEMRHCIFGYAESIALKEYIALSVFGNEQRITAGFHIDLDDFDKTFTLETDQVFGFENDFLFDESIKKSLNKIQKSVYKKISNIFKKQQIAGA